MGKIRLLGIENTFERIASKVKARILKRANKDLEEKLFFGLQMLRMTTRKPPWRIDETLRNNKKRRLNPKITKNFKVILEKASDWWNPSLTSTLEKDGWEYLEAKRFEGKQELIIQKPWWKHALSNYLTSRKSPGKDLESQVRSW